LRDELAWVVRHTRLSVRHQREMAHRGVPTLQKLEEEVLASEAVFHVLGEQSGANAPAEQVENFLGRHGAFADRFPEIAADGRKGQITYTQWEAWFALFFRRRLCVYQFRPAAPAPGQDAVPEESSQGKHVARLREREVYPVGVADQARLVVEICSSLVELHLLTKQELEAPPCNLPYGPLGELFVGRGPFLDDLRRRFEGARRKHPGAWPNHAVTGMAGVGKTRLAIEYGWEHKGDYSALLFVNGESPASLDSHLAGLAGVLRLGLPADAGDPDKRSAVLMKYHEEKEVSLSIATTWRTTIEELSPPAQELLRLVCWLAPEPVPQTFLDALERQRQFAGDIEEAAAELRSYSLLHRPAECGFETPGEAHRLVQLITREQLSAEDKQAYLLRALGVLDDAFQGDPTDVRAWPVLTPLAAHAVEAARHADAAGIAQPTARLMNQLGLLYERQVHFPEAEALYCRALALGEQSFGTDHPAMATYLNNLAALLQATNRPVEAEPLMRRALAIDERAFGTDHPNVARRLNNLARLLQDTNRLGDAEPLMARAVAIFERSLGPNHPHVATALNNLALLLQATNRLAEAEPLMRRALAIDEQAFGTVHPKVAIRLNNLAALLQATNRLGEAEPLMCRALAIDEHSFGTEHPKVAIRLNNLAQLLKATNRLGEAEPLMARVVAIFERSLGPNHPHVATALNNLALLLQATNRLGEAEPLLCRALAIDEQAFGTEHPEVATDLNNLAQLLKATNRLGEAEPLLRRALGIFIASLGVQHPSTQTVKNNYARSLEAMGRGEQEVRAQLNAVAEPYGLSFDD
jgi:tetratricopeptide (TPR) repeat protein